MPVKLAIITSHPVQYYVPLFQQLNNSNNIDLKVFYTWGEKCLSKFDPGFNRDVAWDIPLLDGYNYEWAVNIATDPGTHHFNGIINPGLTLQLNHWQPHALLVIGWGFRSHLQTMKKFKNKIPIYFRGDSTLLDERKQSFSFIRSFVLKWVYRQIDHAFYVGTNNKNYFEKFGLGNHQLSFSPHSIDNDRFEIESAEISKSLRDKLELTDLDTLVLFAGKLEEKKSPMLLLQAFLSLQKKNVHLLFVGSGILKTSLQTAAIGHKNVHFLDFVNQSGMPAIYHACDLFCLPSGGPGETWGLAVNEAMASGKAVLVSDKVGCAVDLVKRNKNGDIFESQNLSDLEQKLEILTESKMKLQRYGKLSSNIIKDWNILETAKRIEMKILMDLQYGLRWAQYGCK